MSDQVLKLGDTPQEILLKMSEGNPGAISVIAKLLETKSYPTGFGAILNLDSMGIRGAKIWVGYKDYCKQDLDAFCELALLRDGDMRDFINKQMGGMN